MSIVSRVLSLDSKTTRL
ncbi:unnamed protein product [Calypogeia fissa]